MRHYSSAYSDSVEEESSPSPEDSAVPADASVPDAIPSSVEPVSGQLVEDPAEEESQDDGIARRKPGPKPMVESHRMKEVLIFIEGRMPCGELGRLNFVRASQFTAREKSYLVNHASFKELYDARLFDFFIGLEMPTKEDLKLLDIVGRRVGLSKPPSPQVNVQVNNNRNAKGDGEQTVIKVKR